MISNTQESFISVISRLYNNYISLLLHSTINTNKGYIIAAYFFRGVIDEQKTDNVGGYYEGIPNDPCRHRAFSRRA